LIASAFEKIGDEGMIACDIEENPLSSA